MGDSLYEMPDPFFFVCLFFVGEGGWVINKMSSVCRLLFGCVDWSEAKMSGILRHWGVQLIWAYSWARPAILVVGKGRGGMMLFLLFPHFHSCASFFLSLSFISSISLLSLFSLSLGDDTKWPTRVDVSLNLNSINHISNKYLRLYIHIAWSYLYTFIVCRDEDWLSRCDLTMDDM